ncbi:MAG: indole-3-glycerol-phosphate synthase, partial [Dehalococcoidia bacterium]
SAILDQGQIERLVDLARELGMECLVEVHNEGEVETALDGGAEIVGINNRDLTNFQVDLDTTRRLRPLIPDEKTVVAESGIFTSEDVAQMEGRGVDAVLVGEALITASDVGAKVRELARLAPSRTRND